MGNCRVLKFYLLIYRRKMVLTSLSGFDPPPHFATEIFLPIFIKDREALYLINYCYLDEMQNVLEII